MKRRRENPISSISDKAMAARTDFVRPPYVEKMEIDPYLAAFTGGPAVENLSAIGDEILAQELQLQEVLEASADSKKPCKDSTRSPDSDQRCDICAQLIPPDDLLDAPPPCPHSLCISCLCRYVDDVLRSHKSSMVKCPREGCDAVLQPELYREFVAPKLFDVWLDAHHGREGAANKGAAVVRVSRQDGLRKSTAVSMEKLCVEDLSKHPTFQFLIQEGCSPDAVSKLVNAALDALEVDLKGKQIVVSPDPAAEFGESSSAAASVAEFECAICMETKKVTDGFDVEGCSHKFCRTCVKYYVMAKVEENAASIDCPEPGCKEGTLHPETCREILPEAVFDRWGFALCEMAVGAARFYCPYKDCSALLMNDGGGGSSSSSCSDKEMTDSECPHCRRMLCVQCMVPWHDGIDCKGFQELGEDEKGREDLMLRKLATSSKWQRCSQCRMYVEKIDGCMFMNCRCGFCFCYVCASPMSKDLHYCEKCRR